MHLPPLNIDRNALIVNNRETDGRIGENENKPNKTR